MPKQLLVCILLLLLCTCVKRDTELDSVNNDEMLPVTILSREANKTYTLESVSSIGSDNDSLYFFANVAHIHVTDQSVYVLDIVFQRLSVYNRQTGVYQWHHDFPKGYGPGEINTTITFAIDSRGYYYVASNQDYRIHIFDQNFLFQRFIQRYGFERLYFIDGVLHILRQPRFPSSKSLVNVIDRDDAVIDMYGKQHSQFNTIYGVSRLQGTGYPYLVSDEDHIYITYALPFEIRTYEKVGPTLISRHMFEPDYVGGTFTYLYVLHYSTGRIVGADLYTDGVLLVFSIHNKGERDYSHYINVVDLQNGTYEELRPSDYGIDELPVYPRYAMYEDFLYLYTPEPFPMIKVMRLVHNPDH